MRISGFTFVRNAVSTTELLRSIGDPKIKIIETVWDTSQFVHGASNAQQTNVALKACSGDWCFYVQADEVVHEDDLEPLVQRMQTYRDDPRVEGLLFEYLHFFADYGLYQFNHSWYRREVRIVRNGLDIRSWKSAQGFRRHTRKIHVVPAGARIFHYGWVRPPRQMTRKTHAFKTLHAGPDAADAEFRDRDAVFDFGQLHGVRPFRGTHPAVMRERIATKDWTVKPGPFSGLDHDRAAQRALSWIENRVLGFRVGEHRNYVLLPP
ncbi:MAG: hypothetical protein HY270_04480 [Deltaproteobacteria bacterium]|nr:hypothetical protein [Deltaproteobacteria bacterium]